MKFKFKRLLAILLAFTCLLLTSCDHKKPEKGYLTPEELTEVLQGFSKTTDYTKYSYEGSMNILDFSEEDVVEGLEVYKNNKEFVDSLEKYNSKSASYYLRMPLHLTYENWTYRSEENSASDSNKYRVESMLTMYGKTSDKVYYYLDEEGNLIIKTFAANNALILIHKDDGFICHGKWNITVTYDKNGYLVSEKFETINARKDKDEKTCYGEATYKFAK